MSSISAENFQWRAGHRRTGDRTIRRFHNGFLRLFFKHIAMLSVSFFLVFAGSTVLEPARVTATERFLGAENFDAGTQPASEMPGMRGLGVVTHFGRGPNWDVDKVLPLLKEMGVTVVRDGPEWAGVERTKGQYVISPGTYDQKHIDRIGKLKNCIAYGPGILDLAHQPDEWVGIDDMVDAAKVMALTLLRLLGPR